MRRPSRCGNLNRRAIGLRDPISPSRPITATGSRGVVRQEKFELSDTNLVRRRVLDVMRAWDFADPNGWQHIVRAMLVSRRPQVAEEGIRAIREIETVFGMRLREGVPPRSRVCSGKRRPRDMRSD